MRNLAITRAALAAASIVFCSCKPIPLQPTPGGGSTTTSLTISPATASVAVADSVRLVARFSINGVVDSSVAITWTTRNASLATVAGSGFVLGRAAGQTRIVATAQGVSDSALVTVALAPVASVAVSPSSLPLTVGQSGTLQATLRDASNHVLTGRTITWSSSNTGVATVTSAGAASGVAAGTATITATSEGKSGSATVSVSAPPPPPPPPPPPANAPELPRVILDTHYSPPTGNTIAVAAGGNLQAALNAAQPCDVITLAAGATFVGSFVLPVKSGSCWITIRSSAPDASLPAEGSRMTPSYASVLPKIVSSSSSPALATAAGAHHYRIIGVELTVASSVTTNYGIVALGDGSSAQSTLAQVPSNLILDRVYVHGNSTLNVSRCVGLNSASSAVIDSYLSECHASGFDSQAIGGWNGPGPFKIVNNYLQGAGEIVMFGGADPAVPSLVPSDIEIRHNHITKPAAWKGVWTVKNLLELKNAQRLLIEGNILENHWPDAQDGFGIVWQSINQGGNAPQSGVRDVTFRYNRLRNSSGGINIAAHPDPNPVVPLARVLIENNVFDQINTTAFPGHGRLFQLLGGPANVTIDHNTTLNSDGSNAAIMMDGAPPQMANLVFRDNVITHGQYGVIGSNVGEGTVALNYYAASGYVFSRNLLVAMNSGTYPTDNFYPGTLAAIGFVNLASGNYRLSATSAYSKKATDGTDPGANMDLVDAATQGVVIP